MRTFKEIKKMDGIIIDKEMKTIKQELMALQNSDDKEIVVKFYFPMNLGYLRINFKEKESEYYFYFVFEEKDDSANIEIYTYDKNNYKFAYMLSAKCGELDNSNMIFKSVDIADEIDFNKEQVDFAIQDFTTAMIYVLYHKDNPKVEHKAVSKNKAAKVKPLNKTEAKKVSRVILGEKVVYEVSGSSNVIKNFKKRQRHIESWSVMAFQRKLKNGKTIIVKSHVRGQGKKAKKEYIVK